MFRDASAVFPEDAKAMGFVDKEASTIFFLVLHDFREWGDVALHRKDPVRHDPCHTRGLGTVLQALEHPAEIFHVRMLEHGLANAFLDDFAVSEDPDKPITAGCYRLEAGQSMTYTYTYHEMKLIIDGEITIADDTGQSITATKGDLFYFPSGSTITFSTEDYGVGYFVGQRGVGEA